MEERVTPDEETVQKDGEDVPLLGSQQFRVYKIRWYILSVSMMVSIVQNMNWNTFGPIADSAELAFNWKVSQIDLLVNFGPLLFLVFAFPCMYMMERWGLRVSILATACIQMIGAVIRIAAYFDKPNSLTYIYTGQILNGIAGPVVMFMPPIISAVWFAPHERTTSTAFGCAAWSMGTAIGYAMSPLIVHTKIPKYPHAKNNGSMVTLLPAIDDALLSLEIQELLYVQAGIAVLAFAFVVAYFPRKPPQPPSPSATVERTSFFVSIKDMFSSWRGWILIVVFAVQNGPYATWLAVAVQAFSLTPLTQQEISLMCLITTLGSIVGPIIFGWISDKFPKLGKPATLVLWVTGGLLMTWLSLLAQGTLPYSKVAIFIAFILPGVATNSVIPIVYEWSVEAAYPAPEGTVTGFLQFFNNLTCAIFLFTAQALSCKTDEIKIDCVAWLNWYQAGALWLTLPLLIFYTPQTKRLNADDGVIIEPPSLTTNTDDSAQTYGALDNETGEVET